VQNPLPTRPTGFWQTRAQGLQPCTLFLSGAVIPRRVAAVAEANDRVVATENERDFAGVKIVNPLRAE